MRSRALTWTLGGLIALGLIGGLALVLQGRGANPMPSVAAEPTTSLGTTTAPSPTVRIEDSAPSTLASTTAADPPATTTTPPATIPPSTNVPATESTAGYVFTPKPPTGPNSIAPGGALTKHLAGDIAGSFGFELGAIEAAVAEVDLPPEAGGNPEGWLAPGTYPDAGNAAQLVQSMVERRIDQLETRGIPRGEWQRVLTAASVVEKETYNQNEKPKVARVLANRLDGGGPLQMDSIILYPVAEDRIFTTSEERSANSPYNSYQFDGLPPTPIAAPDEASIDAFLNPAAGDWWFYVTIDLATGETRYAVTYDEHLDNVELLRAWLADNPTP